MRKVNLRKDNKNDLTDTSYTEMKREGLRTHGKEIIYSLFLEPPETSESLARDSIQVTTTKRHFEETGLVDIGESEFKLVYQGSYREIEFDVLYRLVCGLGINTNASRDQGSIFENVQIILHNISLKNREPKVFTYSILEMFPDLGGEWMSYNEIEIRNELQTRISKLTGHFDLDFTNSD